MDTSGQAKEILSTYEFARRNMAASASSSTGSVSPGTSVKSLKSQLMPRLRPVLPPRWTSEGTKTDRTKISVKGKPIDEGKGVQDVLPDPNPRLPQQHDHGTYVQVSAAALQELGEEYIKPSKLPESVSAKSLHEPAAATLSVVRKSKPGWMRSQSGGIWIRKGKVAWDESSAALEPFSAPDSELRTGSPGATIMPLRPPKSAPRPELAKTGDSDVKVETPFPVVVEVKHQVSTVSRKLSTNKTSAGAPKLLSAPFAGLRRLVKTRSEVARRPTDHLQTVPTPQNESKSHKTGLRKDHTAENLNRVSSLLAQMARAPSIKRRFRAWTAASASSNSSIGSHERRRHRMNRGMTSTFNIFKNRSFEDAVEMKTTSSSVAEMQMGSTPQNTPLEKATYKVKRSASQETEEFFKIDISVRGETSYLPSEARRIHTPPLPEDDERGIVRRRGFFFDYYPAAPTKELNGQASLSQQTSSQGNSSARILTFASNGKNAASCAVKPAPLQDALGKISTKPSVQRTTSVSLSHNINNKPKPNDWYEVQLAELDALIPEDEQSSSSLPIAQKISSAGDKARNDNQIRMSDIRKQQYLDRLDWTIPEHLPSSPLCPRNPRY